MHIDTPAAEPQTCAACQRRRTHQRVCPTCQATMGDQLAYLLAAHRQMPVAQVPVKGGGERIRMSKTAPLPLRLDPLSLAADGRDEEHLTTGGGGVGDQAGHLPIPVWVRAWVVDWRETFGHAKPEPPTLKLRPAAPRPAPRIGAGWVRTDTARQLLDTYLAAIQTAGQREIVRDVLGLNTHVPASGAEPDPVAREWAHRYGQTADLLQLVGDVRYLTTWLPEACERHPDIGAFAASLRTLHQSLKTVLGDVDDRVWLGRCPVGHQHDGHTYGRELHDRDTGQPTVCGAPLWREPFASIVVCPRCGHETPERDLLTLSGWIRVAWPVDRRRRYPVDEVDEIQWATAGKRFGGDPGPPILRMPCCDDCGRPVGVEWKECTERGDVDTLPTGKVVPRRMYRIVRTFCPWPDCNPAQAAA